MTPVTRQEPRVFEFPMRFAGINMGTVNCYLITTDAGCILIDTGFPSTRADLEKKLEDTGCRPGSLRLIIMTHGDQDHTGNGAHLREKYGAKIAMHRDETAVVEKGDDTLSRRRRPFPRRVFNRAVLEMLSLFVNSGKFERFSPDFTIDEGYDFSEYGFDARVLHIPGHSRGSIGILTADGDLFCGDLLWNRKRPSTHSIVDDRSELKASVERLKNMRINMVYPGHGKPFKMESLVQPDE
jgi:glyoxylase-like metal-dependent hydrolase (beta-lactamase superfamily II)